MFKFDDSHSGLLSFMTLLQNVLPRNRVLVPQQVKCLRYGNCWFLYNVVLRISILKKLGAIIPKVVVKHELPEKASHIKI